MSFYCFQKSHGPASTVPLKTTERSCTVKNVTTPGRDRKKRGSVYELAHPLQIPISKRQLRPKHAVYLELALLRN